MGTECILGCQCSCKENWSTSVVTISDSMFHITVIFQLQALNSPSPCSHQHVSPNFPLSPMSICTPTICRSCWLAVGQRTMEGGPCHASLLKSFSFRTQSPGTNSIKMFRWIETEAIFFLSSMIAKKVNRPKPDNNDRQPGTM